MTAVDHRQDTEAKPEPVPTPLTRFYWDAAREHRLVIQRCEACGYYIHWPKPLCPRCGSDRLSPTQVSGRGVIFTFTVVHRAFQPGFEAGLPYMLALIDLEEQPGLRLIANIVGASRESLRIGMPVEVVFEERGGYTLPQFRPVA